MSKPEWPASVTGRDPKPTAFGLYRTSERWRYAIYMNGSMDLEDDLTPAPRPAGHHQLWRMLEKLLEAE